MRKVLHLRSGSGLYGPEGRMLQLVKPMRQEGFDIEMLVLYRRKGAVPLIHPLIDKARNHGLKAEQLEDKAKLSPKDIFYIAQRLKRERFSLIHTHGYKANVLGGIAAKLAGVKSVATVHLHTETTYRLRLYKIIDLLALRFFPKVIAVSESLRQYLIANGLPPKKVVTVHNAVDLGAFTPGVSLNNDKALKNRLGIGGDQHTVSIIGRLTSQKGHHYFLESANRILEVLPETRFLVVGDGPLREDLEGLSLSLGIAQAVRFLGYRQDIATLMSMSDVIAMPSLKEGLPYVLLEALALARPVVGTKVGGIPEVIKHGETGFLVPPKDSKGLAEAIIQVLRNPEEAASLGERGRELVSREFNVETMVQKVAAVYAEVLSGVG
ncbi:MAG: glycosyltransferase family 4 protein [Anaerolineae bacterium]